MSKIVVICFWIVDSAQEPSILEKTAREFPKATLPNPNTFKTEKKAREFPKATQPHIKNLYMDLLYKTQNLLCSPNLKNLYSNS